MGASSQNSGNNSSDIEAKGSSIFSSSSSIHGLLFPDSDREYLTGGSRTMSPATITDDEDEDEGE